MAKAQVRRGTGAPGSRAGDSGDLRSTGSAGATTGPNDDLKRSIEPLHRPAGEAASSLGSAASEISAALSALASAVDPEAMVRLVVDHAIRALEADAGLVGWMNESGRLSSVVSGALDRPRQTPIPFQLIESLAHEAVLNGPVLLDHPAMRERDETVGAPVASMVLLPVTGPAGPPAVLHLSRAAPNTGFTKADVEVAGIFAQLIELVGRLASTSAGREKPAHGFAAGDALLVIDSEGRVLESSAGAVSLLGVEPSSSNTVDITRLAEQNGWIVHEDPSRPGVLLCVHLEVPTDGVDWRMRSQALQREVTAWHTIAQKMLAASGLSEALDDVLLEVVKLTGLPSALIYLYEDASRKLRVAASTGMTAEFVAAVDSIQLGEGFSGRVFLTGEPITTENVSEDWRLSRSIVRAMSLQSYACIPLPGKGRVLGTLGVIGPSRHRFERHEVNFLVSIGRQIGSLLGMAERAHGTWARSQLTHDEPVSTEVTDRQASVIRLLIAGFSPKEIAIRMRISDKTVRNHISHAYARTHVSDRGHLLLWAIAHGLAASSEVPATLEGYTTSAGAGETLEAPT